MSPFNSFSHAGMQLSLPPGSRMAASALRAVAGLTPRHYAANNNDPTPDIPEDEKTNFFNPHAPADAFPTLYARFAEAEKAFRNN